MMALCACICGLPIPFLSSFYIVGILFWGLLFFGGFVLPPVTGIMINSVGDYQKSQANSIANLCYNLLGYLPAPQVYGMISQLTGGKKSRWPMGGILYSTILSVSLLSYGVSLMLKKGEERRFSSIKKNDHYNEEEEEKLIQTKDPQISNIMSSSRSENIA
jgi:sugar phosphate permease